MGVKHFFQWFRKQFETSIKNISKTQTLSDVNVKVDVLLLDLNGIFHNSAQKVFQYGNFKPPPRLLGKPTRIPNSKETRTKLFEDVCESIDRLVRITCPQKHLVLCIDGPAPIGKQNQQRQRRFRTAFESNGDSSFDSNCITPGTEFMHELSLYIDSYIISKRETDSNWKTPNVIFSNEKVPGEGEHKAMQFIREHGSDDDTYCINGMDADLIMLAMSTHKPKFYILRDDMFTSNNAFYCIDIASTRISLLKILKWNSNHKFNEKQAIDDFVFLCFMVGNDFLPHIPSIEIIEAGIELMIEIYLHVGTNYGHLTETRKNGKVYLHLEPVKVFLTIIGQNEKQNFESKIGKKASFFPDPLMIKHSSNNSEGKWNIDIDGYISDYNVKCFGAEHDMKQVSHDYIQGLQWVLSYYTTGVQSWKWYFPHQYAPPASVLATHIDTFAFGKYGVSHPSSPFEQLLSVLPPKSANLIPPPLNTLLTNEASPLRKFCPDKLIVDFAGKRKEWEGITLLPMVDQTLVSRLCKKYVVDVSIVDQVRNVVEKEKIY